MTLQPDDKPNTLMERTTVGLQVSSLLVHVFCCGLLLIVNFAAGRGYGLTLLPFGFESWFHQNEITIFSLAVAMVGVSALMHQQPSARVPRHHSHHDCDDHHHAEALDLQPTATTKTMRAALEYRSLVGCLGCCLASTPS